MELKLPYLILCKIAGQTHTLRLRSLPWVMPIISIISEINKNISLIQSYVCELKETNISKR